MGVAGSTTSYSSSVTATSSAEGSDFEMVCDPGSGVAHSQKVVKCGTKKLALDDGTQPQNQSLIRRSILPLARSLSRRFSLPFVGPPETLWTIDSSLDCTSICLCVSLCVRPMAYCLLPRYSRFVPLFIFRIFSYMVPVLKALHTHARLAQYTSGFGTLCQYVPSEFPVISLPTDALSQFIFILSSVFLLDSTSSQNNESVPSVEASQSVEERVSAV